MTESSPIPSNIFVTQPDLPDLSSYISSLSKIWDSKILTNSGPFHNQLELELAKFLDVPYVSLFCNATIALIVAIRSLDIRGEIITTPFSFAATSHSIYWNNCKPIFVDIDSKTLNLDVEKVRRSITSTTAAILPVHCFGNPCDVEAFDEIQKDYGIPVIYDAAHAFGVKCHCGSILNHGCLSILSFHATKVFNTIEGGAIISHTAEHKEHIDTLRNFGISGENNIPEIGINGKMNELQASLGILQLEKISENIRHRKHISSIYDSAFRNISGINPINPTALEPNYSYYPIIIDDEYTMTRDLLNERMRSVGVFARKYFYPLLSEITPYAPLDNGAKLNHLKVANETSKKILCLPLYPSMKDKDIQRVIESIR